MQETTENKSINSCYYYYVPVAQVANALSLINTIPYCCAVFVKVAEMRGCIVFLVKHHYLIEWQLEPDQIKALSYFGTIETEPA